MRQVHGYDVAGHDQGHLRVPDEVCAEEADVDLVAGGAEEVPPQAQRIACEGKERLALDFL